MDTQALLIFIKNPEKGRVKTRLAATVGDDRALQIYLALLAHTRNIALTIPADRLLFYSAFIDHHDDWPEEDFKKLLQEGEDLGARMATAFEEALRQHEKAVIIGSDCASLTSQIVQLAFSRLDEVDVVIGPAMDGGYYLIGMKSPQPQLFEDMEWSVETVYAETIRRIKASGLTFAYTPTLSDIDREADWEQYGWDIP